MRQDTITTTVYKFDELEPEAQEKAISNLWSINVDYEWWQYVYDDAENINLKITAFDIDRASYLEGDFFEHPSDTARLILENHGESCDTYTLAQDFLNAWEDMSEDEQESDTGEDLCKEFERAIREEYLAMLRREYDYLTGEESITETILANEYEFTIDGKLY